MSSTPTTIEQRRSILEMVQVYVPRGVAFVLRGYLREHSAQAHMTGAMQTNPIFVKTLHIIYNTCRPTVQYLSTYYSRYLPSRIVTWH